jgi:hypothetical protein
MNHANTMGRGGGVAKTFLGRCFANRRRSHAQIFFLQPELLISFKRIQINQTPGFKGVATSQAGKIADLFSGGGGRSKTLQSSKRGPAASQRASFRQFAKTFFWGPRWRGAQKFVAKFRVGG